MFVYLYIFVLIIYVDDTTDVRMKECRVDIKKIICEEKIIGTKEDERAG